MSETTSENAANSAENAPENKTRRVQLVWRPSFYKAVKSAAHRRETSINDFIVNVLEDYLKQEAITRRPPEQ